MIVHGLRAVRLGRVVGAVILMSTEIGNLFNAMAACLSDAVNCSPATF